jgi:hypothetical protein
VTYQVSDFIITLEKFHAQQKLPDGTETISLRTLEDHAASGRLPGAKKVGRFWFVNLLEWSIHASEETLAQETDPAPPSQGLGGSGEAKHTRRPKVSRTKEKEGLPDKLRFPA